MQRMIALTRFPYEGRELKSGDEFDATEQHAFILRGSGKARDKRSYQTRELKAEDSAPRTKRKHTRRDLQASN